MFFKKYKNIIIVVVVVFIIYTMVKKISERSTYMTMPNGSTVGGSVIPAKFKVDLSKVDRKKVFSLGTKNSNEVGYLQTWLNRYYNAKLLVDGDFGSKTNAALLAAKPTAGISFSLDSLGI